MSKESMFFGTYHCKLDRRHSFIMPPVFRLQLDREDNGCIITRGFDISLSLYPFSIWENICSRLENISTNRYDNRAFLRIFFSQAHWVKPNDCGRIVIPVLLRKVALIKRKVSILGILHKIEIWDEKRWREYFEQNKKQYPGIAEDITGLGI